MVGLDPQRYMYMCPADLSLVATGYDTRRRDEWERHILTVNALGHMKKPLSYDTLFGKPPPEQFAVRSKEDFENLKKRFKSLRNKDDG